MRPVQPLSDKDLEAEFLLIFMKFEKINKKLDLILKHLEPKAEDLLSQSEIDEISKDLSKCTGSSLNLDYKVDKELIGGLKLQLGSFMIDTSIKNKLKKYEQAMLES